MEVTQLTAFSEDGEYLAHTSSDGTLRIFECASGTLKQEYSSSSHLSAITTALSWSRHKKESAVTSKSKKRRLSKSPEDETYIDDLRLLALGTTAGSISLYSFAKGGLHTQLTGGHSLKVNDVCWHLSKPQLFSCSDDQEVVQWDLRKGKQKHKWKCDSAGVHSLCQCSNKHLLTAGHKIKLWDLSTRTILQTFTGHASPVFRLLPVSLTPDSLDASYALSVAVDDRHINVWNCDESSNDKNSVASFSVPDEPVSLSLSRLSATSPALLLSVITRKGVVHIFEHTLNGKRKKPLLSKVSIKTATVSDGGDSENTRVPVLCAHVNNGKITVAYGNPVRPQFESVVYNSSQPEVIISVQPRTQVLTKEEFSQVKRPEISQHMTTLIPADLQPAHASKNKGKKRTRRSSVSDLTVEERLNAMSSDVPSDGPARQPPVANTLSRLLQQGLLSGDAKILTGVFQETNETVVRNTLKRLPVSFIVPLIKEIDKGMTGHSQHACTLSRWIAALISCHTSYIVSVPEVMNTVSRLCQTMVSKQKFHPKMLHLKGRLELVKRGGKASDAEEENDNEPVLTYQDESESEGSDSLVIDGNDLESDDNWEDISDMET
ncbi:hypothetical protein BsWGS_10650 [Bradybaena similaris]